MILETSGEMRDIANTVILEGVTCDGHTILGGCSPHVFHLWREPGCGALQTRPIADAPSGHRHAAVPGGWTKGQ